MARYGHSNHWRWQPRDMNGRFASSGGGGSKEDPLNDWFLRTAWWKKLLFLAGFALFAWWLVTNGYVLVFIICAWVLVWIMKLITAWLGG